MKAAFLPLIILAATMCNKENSAPKTLEAPSELGVELASPESAVLSWKDNCSSETGYYVFKGLAGEGSFKEPSATLPANTVSFLFDGLAPDTEYRFGVQAFGKDNTMSTLVYSATLKTPAKEVPPTPPVPEVAFGEEIEAITFSWTEVGGLSLPSTVKIYKTEDPLNGRAFNAWYAIADPLEVAVRVLYPGNGVAKTIDQQASGADGCLVLVNGGIFSAKFILPIGFAIFDGTQTPWRVVEDDGLRIDREYWSADGKLHPVSRGMFGVDASGKPGVYWSFSPSHGTVYVYDKPIPSTAGETPCPAGSLTYPCTPASWVPYNALTCGPVLLKGGKCPINAQKTSGGYWATNYELWADDIFGVNQRADRTAVGYTAEGKVILCICDGRIAASQGATTLEMAAVMKGLGCVGALNLDGGGSTGMWAAGQHLNSLLTGSGTATENRAVMTTVGFFQKK